MREIKRLMKEMDLKRHEEPGTPPEPPTEPGAGEGAEPGPSGTPTPPTEPPAPGGSGDSAFKLFKTEEEFNAHAAGIRKNAASRIAKEMGFENVEEMNSAVKSAKDITTQLNSFATENAQLKENVNNYKKQETTFKLVSAGIDPSKVKYAQVDIAEAGIDIADDEALKSFVENSMFKLNTQTEQKEPEVKPGTVRVPAKRTVDDPVLQNHKKMFKAR